MPVSIEGLGSDQRSHGHDGATALGRSAERSEYRRGKIVITKTGKPVAALVDIETFERLRKSDEEFERLRGEIRDAFAGQPEDDVRALVAEAAETARGRRAEP